MSNTTAVDLPTGESVLDGERLNPPHEEVLHQFRKNIDKQIMYAEYLLGMTADDDSTAAHIRQRARREIALVRTKLQEAKMWSGKALEVLGAPFPEHLRDKAK